MTIAHYAIAGQAVESEIPLPELGVHSARDGGVRLYVRLGGVKPAPRRVVSQERLEDGRLWRVVFGTPEGYLFQFPELALFSVSREGDRIEFFREPGIPDETLRHLLLDQVLPFLAPFWGGVAFHASAVVTPGGAVAFLGATGRGKSTLAAAFAKRGFTILSDDSLSVFERKDGFHARPWYSGVRLWPEHLEAVWGPGAASSDVAHYTRKRRVTTPGDGALEVPVRALFLLEPPGGDGEVATQRLSVRDAAVELTRHAFFLDSEDHAGLRHFFERIARLSDGAPVFRLFYPRSLRSLDRVVEEIGADAKRSS